MKRKKCTTCKKLRSVSTFNRKTRNPDGLQNICRMCSQARSRAYYAKNRDSHRKAVSIRKHSHKIRNREFILKYLKKNPCVDCGEKTPACLDFDHVRPGKAYNISEMINGGYSLESIQKEISLCDVRCANCHRKKTAKDQNWYCQA